MCEAFLLSQACFIAFLHMCKLRIVDLFFASPLSVHISAVFGKPFPFQFKMHDIILHIGLNLDSALKANAGCIYPI